MKFKALAAAVALMSSATVANAAWNEGTGVNDGSYLGDGELLLVMWDSVRNVSVMQDLGGSYVELWDARLTGGEWDFALDPLVAQTFAGSDMSNVVYSVFANNYGFFDAEGFNEPARFSNGIMVTTNVANPTYDRANGGDAAIQSAMITSTASVMQVSTDIDYATNIAVYGDTTNGKFAGANDIYGFNLYNRLPNVTGATNESLYMWAFLSSQLGSQDVLVGEFTLNMGDGNLHYSAVPVPAAVWLLASGLLGLGAVSRRRKA